EAKDDLTAGAATHGDRLGLPGEDPRARARLLDTAQTLLHAGSTIRQAGDSLGVPTSTLRRWLRPAGVAVGSGGTLPGGPQTQTAPAPATTLPTSGEAKPAVSVLNERAQTGKITTPVWETAATGPPHAPTFTVTATTTSGGETVSACGAG